MAPLSRSPDPAAAASADPWGWRPAMPSVVGTPVSLLRLKGPDSLRFLHGQTSQAIELARPGQWLSTCCITPTARLRALAEVLVSEDGAWLVIREGDGATVRQALDRVLFPADAVELGPLRAGLLLEPVPGAGEANEDTAAVASDSTGHSWRPLEGGEGFWLGEVLLLLDLADGAADGLEAEARALLARPRLEGVARERWRIQAGWPGCPAEVNDDTNPFELGLAARVSLNKGCYVGQETLAKLATYDGVNQQLRRWAWAGEAAGVEPERVLVPGAPLTTATGERAGQISSVLALPAERSRPALWIGLALVRRNALEDTTLEAGPGLTLRISCPDAFQPPPGSGSRR